MPIPSFTHFVHKPSLSAKVMENIMPLIIKTKQVCMDNYLKTLHKSISQKQAILLQKPQEKFEIFESSKPLKST